MDELQITARFRIHDGKAGKFRDLANACIETVKKKEPNAIQYDWFFSQDGSECVSRERYRNSNELLQHVGNLGDLFGGLLAVSDLTVEVYGEPSDDLLDATEDLNTVLFSYHGGL